MVPAYRGSSQSPVNLKKQTDSDQLLPPHHVWRSQAARTAAELNTKLRKRRPGSRGLAAKPGKARVGADGRTDRERFILAVQAHHSRLRSRDAEEASSGASGKPTTTLNSGTAAQIYAAPADRLYSVSPLRKQTSKEEMIRVWKNGRWRTFGKEHRTLDDCGRDWGRDDLVLAVGCPFGNLRAINYCVTSTGADCTV